MAAALFFKDDTGNRSDAIPGLPTNPALRAIRVPENDDTKTVVFQRALNVLIMDDASWHRRRSTNGQRWQPNCLPPYWPDLTPIARIWLRMEARWFNHHICSHLETLTERLDQARLDVINNPEKTQQPTAIGTLF